MTDLKNHNIPPEKLLVPTRQDKIQILDKNDRNWCHRGLKTLKLLHHDMT